MKYRKATLDDIKGIFDVMIDTGYRKKAFGHLSDKKAMKAIEVKMNDKDRIYVVAEDKKRIVGYSIVDTIKGKLKNSPVELNQKYAYSQGIGIHSNYRRKGIAKELYNKTLSLAKKKYKGFYADVDSKNKASLKLHEKVGFKKIAEYEDERRKKQSGINVVFVKEFKWYNFIL